MASLLQEFDVGSISDWGIFKLLKLNANLLGVSNFHTIKSHSRGMHNNGLKVKAYQGETMTNHTKMAACLS